MNSKKKHELMTLLGITDERVVDDVMRYAQQIQSSEAERSANDIATAKVLNDYVLDTLELFKEPILYYYEDTVFDTTPINRIYVLMVDKLKGIYDSNSTLSAIEPGPIWRKFDVIKGFEEDIRDYFRLSRNDNGRKHMAHIEKLFIVVNEKKPTLSLSLQRLINEANEIIPAYEKHKQEMEQKRLADRPVLERLIPEYTLTYGIDGTIAVNNVLTLKKVHAGSTTERLLEQAMKQPGVLFKPNLGKTTRNISTILNSAGFNPVLRALFFPTVNSSKGVVFRKKVSHKVAKAEGISTADLDIQLIKAGADFEYGTDAYVPDERT